MSVCPLVVEDLDSMFLLRQEVQIGVRSPVACDITEVGYTFRKGKKYTNKVEHSFQTDLNYIEYELNLIFFRRLF